MAKPVETSPTTAVPQKEKCGIIMPLADMSGFRAGHFAEMQNIIENAVISADLDPMIVSDGSPMSIIHTRIVKNLYEHPIVICDVSGKNPNVMFELGLRIAFNKPVVVVCDRETGFSFDTNPIQHVIYPRDLRYSEIETFKSDLRKILDAFKTNRGLNEDGKTYLDTFGQFKTFEIKDQSATVSASDYIETRFEEISLNLHSLKSMLSSMELLRRKEINILMNQMYSKNGLPVFSRELKDVQSVLSGLSEAELNLKKKMLDSM